MSSTLRDGQNLVGISKKCRVAARPANREGEVVAKRGEFHEQRRGEMTGHVRQDVPIVSVERGDLVGAGLHPGHFYRGATEEWPEPESPLGRQRLAISNDPQDGLAVVGASIREQVVGL